MTHHAVGLNQQTIRVGIDVIESSRDLGHMTSLMVARDATTKFLASLRILIPSVCSLPDRHSL
jgi:hypothetical protein